MISILALALAFFAIVGVYRIRADARARAKSDFEALLALLGCDSPTR
jgi:hypothetical protein